MRTTRFTVVRETNIPCMGNTLIVYASNYGTVEKCAWQLFQHLSGNVDICNLQGRAMLPRLENYQAVIVGGSIRFGAIHEQIARYCTENMEMLLQKKLGLFINCLLSGEKAKRQLEGAFPPELIKKAVAYDYFGGEFSEHKMTFWERAAIAAILKSGIAGGISVSDEKITNFAMKMNRADERRRD